jgi:hypothetical protein
MDGVDAYLNGTAARARSNVVSAVGSNPETEAELARLSRVTGVPIDSVRTDPVPARQAASSVDFDITGMQTRSPNTVSFLASDPHNAKIAQGDTHNLAGIDEAAKKYGEFTNIRGPKPTVGSYINGVWENFAGGANIAWNSLIQAATEAGGSTAPHAEYEIAKSQLGIDTANPGFSSKTSQGIYGGVTSLAQAVPGIAASIAVGNPAPAIMLGSMQSGGQAYSDYRYKGASVGKAQVGALANAAIEAATEFLPMETIVNKLGKTGVRKFVSELVLKDMVGEQIATAGQDAIDTAEQDKPDWKAYLAARPDAAYQTALAVGVMGGSVGAVHAGMHYAADAHNAEESVVATNTIQGIHDLAAASKVRERDPATFEDFVKTATQDGPLEHVWISGDALAQAVSAQVPENAMDPNGVAHDTLGTLPSAVSQLAEARATGGDVQIPTSEFAAIAGTPLAQSLLPHLKADPQGMSQTEAKTFMDTHAERLKEDVARVLDADNATDNYRASADRVKQGFLDQFNKVNRFTPDVNDIYASTASAIYTTGAAKLGMTPEEMQAKYPLHINAEGVLTPGMLDQAEQRKPVTTKMTPNEFLDLVLTKEGRDIVAKDAGEHDPAKETPDATHPFVSVDDLGQVTGYDGRHRMARLVAAGKGDEEIPVHLKLNGRDTIAAGETLRPTRSRGLAYGNGTKPLTLRSVQNAPETTLAQGPNSATDLKVKALADNTPGLAKMLPYLTKDEQAKLRKDSAAKIMKLFNDMPSAEEMASVAYSGRAKRGWYENSAQTLLQVFGMQDATRFAALLAATSPQSSVEDNAYNALSTWVNWGRAGRPTGKDEIIEIMGKSVKGGGTSASVLNAWINNAVQALSMENPADITLSGPKVNSFMMNLVGITDEVTNDAWMANYALMDQSVFAKSGAAPGKGVGYMTMSALTRRAAAIISRRTGETWTPAEVQETVWSWARTLYNKASSETTAQQILAAGGLTSEDIGSTPDFSLLFLNGVYRKILEHGGYGEQLETIGSGSVGPDGADGRGSDPFSAEGSGIAEPTYRRHLNAAAKRLDQLRANRNAAEAENRNTATLRQDAVGEPLQGMPTRVKVDGAVETFGPYAPAREAAAAYAESAGLTYAPPTDYVRVDEARAAKIAAAYEAMPNAPNDPAVKASYDAMIAETLAQWEAIKATGLTVEFNGAGKDPYGNPRNAILDVTRNNHLWVFPTSEGFGSSDDVSGNPLLALVPGEEISGRPVQANDIFRIVHDYFGHIAEGVGFRADGEENAWRQHSAMYSELARPAMTTETRGQNSWVNYGPHGEANRTASGGDTVYAPQKIGLLPDWVVNEGSGQDSPGALKKWFGDSKVVDDKGDPLVVYHGTTQDFDTFEVDAPRAGDGGVSAGDTDTGWFGKGVYFTPSKRAANSYANQREGSNVMPSYVKIEKPFEVLVDYADSGATTMGRALSKAGMENVGQSATRHTAWLKEQGYDGVIVRYAKEDGTPGSVGEIVAFAPDQIKSAIGNDGTYDANDPNILSQTARGLYNPATSTITILKNADLSTVLHELGHHQLEVLAKMASMPNPPASVTEDMNHILKWFMPHMTLQMWMGMSLEEQRPYHEKFARGFETYLFEGKAPNAALRPVFQRVRSWMLQVYKNISALGVTLTPEVRGVFDRMLAVDGEIAQAETMAGFNPDAGIDEVVRAGMSEAQWRDYQQLGAEATANAAESLQARSLRDMRWLSNARDAMIRKLQGEAAAKRKAVKAEVTAEVMAEPVNRARMFLKRGLVDGEAVEGPHKLSLPELRETYGKAQYPQTMPDLSALGYGKYGMLAEDGMHPEQVAELFGYGSADAMIHDLLTAPPSAEKINGQTDQRMLERYGDLTDQDSIERAADQALHNEARIKFNATQMNALAKAAGSPRTLASAARDFATDMVARLKVRDLRPSRYSAAERRAGVAASKAAVKGDLVEAATQKRNQVINGYATKATHEAQAEVERVLRYFAKFSNDGTRKAIDPDYRDQIDALLERFDLRKGVSLKEIEKRKSLAAWVESQRDMGYEPVIPDELLNDANHKHYKDMTLEELRGLRDAVKNVEHLGRLKQTLLTTRDQRNFAAAVDEAATTIQANALETRPDKLERNTLMDVAQSGVEGFFAAHRKFSSLISQMGGFKEGGPLWDMFIRNQNAASDRETTMIEKSTIALDTIFKPIFALGGKALRTKMFIPEINASLSLEGRLMIALNWGNETNRARVMDGDKWEQHQVEAILNTLTPEQWGFVQQVWDHIDSYWPEIAAKQRRVTGVEPERVTADAFTTPSGIDLKGGYFPIKYDPDRSEKAAQDNVAATIKASLLGAYTAATTRRGHTKARVDKVERPMRKDFGVIFQHIAEVTHDLAWHEYLIDANRLLKAPAVSTAIRTHYGPAVLNTMKSAIEDMAAGSLPGANAVERGLNYLRSGATIAGLGWNLTTALMQPIGLTQSMARIGPKWVAKGLMRWVGDASQMESSVQFIFARSEFMRLRAKTQQREISEIRNRVSPTKNQALGAVEDSFFYLIGKMQMVADVPTWLGQYEKMMDAGHDEAKAAALADQAVIDAQGGGQIKDLAEVQRGSAAFKLFTNFYSYMNVIHNLMAESIAKTRKDPKGMAPRLVSDTLLLMIIPTFLTTLLRAAMKGDDKDLPVQITKDQLGIFLSTMVGFRELAGLIGSDGRYEGPAGLRFFSDAGKLYQQAQQGEADIALLKAANNVAGVFFHYPAGQVQRTVTGIMALKDGKTHNPMAILAGPPPAAK